MREWREEIRRRLGDAQLPAGAEAEVVEELAQHLQERYEELRARGIREEEARRLTLEELSTDEPLGEGLRRAFRAGRGEPVPLGAQRGSGPLASLWSDLRFGVRLLRRNPAFTVIAVLTLALGIGANTAVFSVINGVLLRPLPFPEPHLLVAVGEGTLSGSPTAMSVTTPGSFFDWQQQTTSIRLAGISGSEGVLTGRGEPERFDGATTVGGLFEVLQVRPLLGRPLLRSDEDPQAERVIVLSYGLWRRLFGEDRGAIGGTLTLDGTPRTIVGVMPPSFRFPDVTTQFWVPSRFEPDYRANRDQYFIQVVGRLAPGATLEQARAELEGVAERLRQDWPAYNTDLRILVRPLQETIVEGVRTRLLLLMGAVVLVLLITCANLGNLLLARAASRRREIALRRALGARGSRVAQQLLVESLTLALAGGVVGLLVGNGLLRLLLSAQVVLDLPRVEGIALDHRVLIFTFGTALAAGLFFGSFPAWHLVRRPANEALREGPRASAGPSLARSALVVSQIALAIVLLTGAGLLLRSFAFLQRVDPGFTADRLLTFDVSLPAENPAFFQTSLEQLQALPGVRSAAIVSQLPVTGWGVGAWFNRLDRPLPPDVKPTGEAYRVVSPEFFATIALPLRRGRLPMADDRRERPAVVINEALAKKYYPEEDPIGREIYLGAPDNRLFDRAPIVGVVGNTRDAGLGSDPIPTVYIPHAVMPAWRWFSFVIRTTGSPTAIAPEARNIIRRLDPSLPIASIRTVDAVLAESMAPARWSMMLLSIFAAVALVTAVLGVFGVLSFLVALRTREIGIRMALGARAPEVLRQVLRDAARITGLGIGLGVAAAIPASYLLRDQLFGVSPTDPATLVAVVAVLAAAAVAAAYLPARRATRVDPAIALRHE